MYQAGRGTDSVDEAGHVYIVECGGKVENPGVQDLARRRGDGDFKTCSIPWGTMSAL